MIAAALAPSLPIGFSTMMRERGRHEPFRAETLGDRAEQVGARRQIIGADAFVGAEQRLQILPNRRRSSRRPRHSRVRARKRSNAAPAPSSAPANFINASLTVARNASRSSWRRETPMMRVGSVNWSLRSRLKQRRVELAIGEIAGAAEDDEIEWLDFDDARGHDASLWSREKRWSLGTVHRARAAASLPTGGR